MKEPKIFFKERDWKMDIITWLTFIGIGGAIIGIAVFPLLIVKFGFTWWNILGTIVSLFACCVPMLLEKMEKKN